ncbi:MAG: hypothetical protein NVSMB51_10860 [Solirubrobacteraceae bacterium]
MRRATLHQSPAADPVAADRPVRTRRARMAGVAGGGALALARLIRLITGAVVFVILLAIALRVLDANTSNSLVSGVHDAAKWLVGPFDTVFRDNDPKLAIAENWGLAAFVYLIAGSFIAGLIGRAAAPYSGV